MRKVFLYGALHQRFLVTGGEDFVEVSSLAVGTQICHIHLQTGTHSSHQWSFDRHVWFTSVHG